MALDGRDPRAFAQSEGQDGGTARPQPGFATQALFLAGGVVHKEAQPGSPVYDPSKGTLPKGACDGLLADSHFGMGQMHTMDDHAPTDPAGSGN